LADLTAFMEAQLEYYKKCTDLLITVKSSWPYSHLFPPKPFLPNSTLYLPSAILTRSALNKPRPRTRAPALYTTHLDQEEPSSSPSPPEPLRPVISTKYKSSISNRASPTHATAPNLRRIQTDSVTVVHPPRPTHANGRLQKKVMRCDHAFDAESDSEMSIVPGDLINVIEEVDAGWFIGEIVGDEARTGMFPTTYCTVIEPTVPTVRRPPLKPPSPTARSDTSSLAGDLDDQVSNISIRRASYVSPPAPRQVITRTQSANTTSSVSGGPNIAMAKKKAPPPPPPPVSRGNKPVAGGGVANEGKCRECGCVEFRANVFKKGSCNNCFHVHGPL